MADPFEQLRAAPVRTDPDPRFAARLRTRLARRLALPRGFMMTTALEEPTTRIPPRALVPYLAVDDARRAIEWYVAVFDARLRDEPIVMPDGRVGHAEIVIDGALLMLADPYPEIGHAAPRRGESAVSLHLDVEDVDRLVDLAAGAGAEVIRAPSDQGYGRSATIIDPFGHRWMLVAAARDPGTVRQGDIGYASLGVPSAGRAAAFYGEVLGWSIAPDADPERAEVEGSVPSHGIHGGVERPTLFVCFAVDDAVAAAERVRAAGGTASAVDARPYGLISDCVDDQGMPFAVWEPPGPSPRAGADGWSHGQLTYVTLEVVDAERFKAFFSSVLGWEFTPGRVEQGWNVTGAAPLCGVHGGHAETTVVPMYVVDDVEAAVRTVRGLGGEATDPERAPYGISATCRDDQGTRFYLVEY